MTNSTLEQLTMFHEPVSGHIMSEDALQKMEWSYSRRSMFEQCARKYYNVYFGANKRTALQEQAKVDLHFLKGLSNRYERTGWIAHLAIKLYFRDAQQGKIWNTQRLISFAREIFQKDQTFSRTHPDGTDASEYRYPPVLLREYHYHQPDADVLCREAEDRLVDGLRTFITDSQFAEFRLGGSQPDALVEHSFGLTGFPCKVTGQIDLFFRQDNTMVIVDWKLGPSDGTGYNSLQLATYALWAIDYFGCSPEQIRVCKAHLCSHNIVDFEASEDHLAMARGCILQDIERMAPLQPYGHQGIAETFTPCLQQSICHQCAFERLCYA